jgi:hypothetical protein
MHTIPAGVLSAIVAGQVQTCHLVEMFLSSGTVRLTDFARTVSYGGNDFLPAGHLLALSEIVESAQVIVSEASVTLSGVDQTFIAALLGETYLDRRLVIYRAFLDANSAVSYARAVFDGRMDAPTIQEDPLANSCTVTVTATNYWADFERRPGRHTNYEETQLYFPGDKFFEFTAEGNKQITWGQT